MKAFFHLIFFLACSMLTYAQQDSLLSSLGGDEYVIRQNKRQYSRTIEFEFLGKQTRYNTSISPLLQEGSHLGVFYEYMPHNVGREKKVKSLLTSELRYSNMSTIFGGGGLMSFSEKLSFSVLYDIKPLVKFHVYAGAGVCADMSIDLSKVNSNNVVGFSFDFSMLQATIRPEYVLKAKRRDIKLIDNFNMSLVRLSTLPLYGEPSSAELKCNAFSYVDFANRFTIQLPMKRTTFSISHVLEREKIDKNMVDRRRFVSSFAFGLNVFAIRYSGRLMKYDSDNKRIKD